MSEEEGLDIPQLAGLIARRVVSETGLPRLPLGVLAETQTQRAERLRSTERAYAAHLERVQEIASRIVAVVAEELRKEANRDSED